MQELTEIINWRRISDKITTSGQPSEEQLIDIQKLGVTHVINLGPHDNKGALDDEATSVAKLGMEYIYIPVDFSNPTESDFTKFCDALERLEWQTIHVHCIYNARVSAFFYRYAAEGLGGDKEVAFKRMDGIWRPGGVWANFIGDDEAATEPNKYAGYEY